MSYDILSMFNATAVSLRVPSELRERIHRYVRQHQGGALIAEQAPFRRQLDFWSAGIAVACAKGLDPRSAPSSDWGSKFVDTRGVQMSSALAELLVTLAASDFGLEDPRLSDPHEVMELANRYAGAGIPIILEWLEDPGLRQTNIEKIVGQLKKAREEAEEALEVQGKEEHQAGLEGTGHLG